jgi:hypothetical protein
MKRNMPAYAGDDRRASVSIENPGRRVAPVSAVDIHEVPNLLKFYDITMGQKPQH